MRILRSLFLAGLALLWSCSKDTETPKETGAQTYTITVSAGEGGTVNTQGGTYEQGAKVTLTALPDAAYLFTGWSDGNTDNPREITVSANLTLIANFRLIALQAVVSRPISPFLEGTQAYSGTNLNLNQFDRVLGTHSSFWYIESELSQLNEWTAGRGYLTKDFNNDGFTDLFVSFLTSEQESVPFKMYLYNPGTQEFEDQSNRIQNNTGQPFNRKAMSADLNGDGILDVVAVSHPEREAEEFSYFDVVMSSGTGSWEQKTLEKRSRMANGPDDGYYHGFALGDVDLDGDIDIVMGMWHNTQEGITTYLNDGLGNFTPQRAMLVQSDMTWELETMSFTQELIDFNGDDCLDLIFWGSSDIVIKKGNCDGTFGPYYIQIPVNFGMDFRGMDLDQDGDQDLIILKDDYTDNQIIYVFENQSTTNEFILNEASSTPAPKFGIGYISLIDLNGDGKMDVVPAGPLRGYDDLDLTDGSLNPYYPNSPVLLSTGNFTFEIADNPILTPLEQISFNTANGTLRWKAAFPMQNDDASQPYDPNQVRGQIASWKIYYSNAPFTFAEETGVQVLTLASEAVQISTNTYGESQFSAALGDIAAEGVYIRIGSVDSRGIKSNLSYMVQLEGE
ncbi:MAG: hypothetical protein RLZZ241_1244 [Bacteroidota bacterium]|jgi:hypothetical protein